MPSLITLDFETAYSAAYSLKKLPTLLYIADPRFYVYGVGVKIDNQPTEWVSDMDIAIKELQGMQGHTLLAHNTKFDGTILQFHHDVTFKRYADTMAMASGLSPHGSSSLATLCEMLWPDDPTMRKGEELEQVKGVEGPLSPEQDKIIGDYCINDVDLTYEAYQKMAWYPESELDVIDLTCRMYIKPRLILDEALVAEHRAAVLQTRDDAVVAAGIEQPILSSNQQYAEYMQGTLGIKPPMKISKTTGQPTFAFGKNDLAYIKLRASKPEHNKIWLARDLVKSTQEITRSKRLLEAAAADDGWLRVPLKYYAAHTGRYGGGEKLNLQNLGRTSKLRLALTAPTGNLVYVRDLSQIEARVLAAVAGQEDLIQQFRDGEDVYSIFASDVYNRPVDRKRIIIDEDGNEITPDKTEGHVGKVCILGLGYSMSATTLRTTLAVGALGGDPVYVTEIEATGIVRTYRTKNNSIVHYWKACDQFIKDMTNPETDYMYGPIRIMYQRILLPNGMALTYPHLHQEPTQNGFQWLYASRNGWTSLYGGKLTENIIQALARIVICDHMTAADIQLPTCDVVLNVHDEIILVGPDENPKAIDTVLENIMSTPPSWLPNTPITSEGGWDTCYSK